MNRTDIPGLVFRLVRFLIALSILASCSSSVHAIELGQVDDFEAGEQSWIWGRSGFGGPIAVQNEKNESTYLETESFGGGDAPGSRMALINREQWTGDYVAAGIGGIRLEALNDGPNFAFEDMTIRLGFSSELASTGSGRVVTGEAFSLVRDSGWQQLEFDLSDLLPIAGSDVTEVMSSVSEVRIISAAEPSFIGEQVIARLGVDNITAVGVPEPSGALQSLLAMLGLASVCRYRKMKKMV